MDYSSILKNYAPSEIAKYYRLSLEDRNKKGGVVDESESISNQRSIINNFIDKRGNVGSLCREFIDDGYSGTNFDRDGWKELLDEVDNGNIKVVITKNLSRLGRSNFECGYYMDYYFPSLGIRFMTVQEEVDTSDIYNSSNEYAPLTNFMNEKYSRDLSKNVTNSKRAKQKAGEYIGGSNTPFGYKRDPADKHHLIIEEAEACAIRLIFKWYLETKTLNEVVRKLFEYKIARSSYVRNYKHVDFSSEYKKYSWDSSTVKRILENQVYIGSMVQHKYVKKSWRRKKLSRVPKEEWIIVPNKHEPIIDVETFEEVQLYLDANYKSNSTKPKELLQGLLVCHDCKHKMSIAKKDHVGKDGKTYKQYYTQCVYYRKNRHLHLCTLHSVNYFEVENEVLNQITSLFKQYIKLFDFDGLTQQAKEKYERVNLKLQEKIKKINGEIHDVDRKLEISYMDRLDDKISIETYGKIAMSLEDKKKQLQLSLDETQDTLIEYQTNNEHNKLLETKKIVSEYLKSRKKVDRDLILSIVDRVEIHEDKSIDLHLKLKPLEQVLM